MGLQDPWTFPVCSKPCAAAGVTPEDMYGIRVLARGVQQHARIYRPSNLWNVVTFSWLSTHAPCQILCQHSQ